jgi:hypothetical protein
MVTQADLPTTSGSPHKIAIRAKAWSSLSHGAAILRAKDMQAVDLLVKVVASCLFPAEKVLDIVQPTPSLSE